MLLFVIDGIPDLLIDNTRLVGNLAQEKWRRAYFFFIRFFFGQTTAQKGNKIVNRR